MKLIFCPSCQDMVKLQQSKRTCQCGKSWGQYTDHIRATTGGLAIAIGVDNHSFAEALRAHHVGIYAYPSLEFAAFIFSPSPEHITKEP